MVTARGLKLANPIPWSVLRISRYRNESTKAIKVPDTPKMIKPISVSFLRPYTSARTPIMGIETKAEKKNTDMTNPICCSGISKDCIKIGSAGDTSWPPSTPMADTNKIDKRVESIFGITDCLLAGPIYFYRLSG